MDSNKEKDYQTPDQIAESMLAKGKNKKRNDTAKTNRLWIWLGIIVLIIILVYWLFVIGTGEDLIGYFNG
ncbi:MAG: hypothetical protein HDR48_05080 [Bacteroides sp.]|nr:hypothetical protein [Bacteroides sp.]MDE7462450.1 hypothetical protein [Muribaculaceae bacterium]